MSLTDSLRSLRAAGRPSNELPPPSPPSLALYQLLDFAQNNELATDHPWELGARVCRLLEDVTGRAPAGGWARLVGLAAGTGVLRAQAERFEAMMRPHVLAEQAEHHRTRLVEAFTCRLIPPAAAAALYVSLDIHPLWGLRLGRDVGSTSASLPAPFDNRTGLERTRDMVFGTLCGLVEALRGLDPAQKYPIDALGDLLWWTGQHARRLARPAEKLAIRVSTHQAVDERRAITTRLAVADILDYVFVPAGVARRDDAGWFRVDAPALESVSVGTFDPPDQRRKLGELLQCDPRVEAC